jgi:hypothetical protein
MRVLHFFDRALLMPVGKVHVHVDALHMPVDNVQANLCLLPGQTRHVQKKNGGRKIFEHQRNKLQRRVVFSGRHDHREMTADDGHVDPCVSYVRPMIHNVRPLDEYPWKGDCHG